MTWQRFLATGSGAVALRVVIEGLAVEFVSDPAMEKTTSDGRRRIYCAPADAPFFGATIEEKVNIPEAVLDPSGTHLSFFETDAEDLAGVFAHRPDKEWFVSATVTAGANSVSLLGVGDLATDDVVHLGTEAMKVVAVGASSITVTRAYWDTIAQKHWSNNAAFGIPYRILTNRPERIRGRRVYFYAYGDGDDLTGDGTRVWIGTVASEPAVSEAGTRWSLMVDSIGARLESTMGGELSVGVKARGIYYSAHAGLRVFLQEYQSGIGIKSMPAAVFTGFYETQEAFCAALTAWLSPIATAASLLSTYTAVPDGDRWTLQCAPHASVEQVFFGLSSAQDGQTINTIAVDTTAGTVVTPRWLAEAGHDDARMVPRGYYGGHANDVWHDATVISSLPPRRIYIDGAIASDATAVRIEWGGGSAFDYTIVDRNDTSGWIELGREPVHADDLTGGGINAQRYGAFTLPQIRPSRLIAFGTLADLMTAITTNAPDYCNRGTWPFLTSTDVDISSFAAADATSSAGRLGTRVWRLAEPVELDKLLAAEMQLRAQFPIILSDGRIGAGTLELPTRIADLIDLDEEMVSAGWSDMERGGQTINQVILRTHYDPAEDDWSRTVTVINEHAFASDHEPRQMTIEPRSIAAAGDDAITSDELAAATLPVVAVFSYPHDIVSVHVPWTFFETTTLGAKVAFSAIHLPDGRFGERPIDSVLGVVIGRRWVFGDAHGTLRVLLPGLSPRGYSPTARVTATTANDSDWVLTVDASMYAPSGAHPLDYWEAGYRCRIVEYDSESATVVAGTIKSVNKASNQITVTFDSTFTPGSSTWELCWAPYDDQTDDQKKQFAAVAESDGYLDGDPPDTYAS